MLPTLNLFPVVLQEGTSTLSSSVPLTSGEWDPFALLSDQESLSKLDVFFLPKIKQKQQQQQNHKHMHPQTKQNKLLVMTYFSFLRFSEMCITFYWPLSLLWPENTS